MNEITKPNTTAPAQNNPDYNPYVAYGEQAAMTRIVGQLLKFDKFGEWIAGQEGEVIAPGTKMIANMAELMVGWIKWQDGKPTEQVMGRVLENFQPPKRNELGDTDEDQWETDNDGKSRDPWQFSNYLILMSPDDYELYTYATSSRGGLQAVGLLSKEYGHAMRHRPNQFPVITLGGGSYPHPNKEYGKIKIPVLEVVGWTDRGDIDKALESKHAGGEETDGARTAAATAAAAAAKKLEADDKAAANKPKPGTRF